MVMVVVVVLVAGYLYLNRWQSMHRVGAVSRAVGHRILNHPRGLLATGSGNAEVQRHAEEAEKQIGGNATSRLARA
jgi:hypothetical protein